MVFLSFLLNGYPRCLQKTTPHHGRTISHGDFEIRETIHVCADRCRFDSGKLVTRRADTLSHPAKLNRPQVLSLMQYFQLLHELCHVLTHLPIADF